MSPVSSGLGSNAGRILAGTWMGGLQGIAEAKAFKEYQHPARPQEGVTNSHCDFQVCAHVRTLSHTHTTK